MVAILEAAEKHIEEPPPPRASAESINVETEMYKYNVGKTAGKVKRKHQGSRSNQFSKYSALFCMYLILSCWQSLLPFLSHFQT